MLNLLYILWLIISMFEGSVGLILLSIFSVDSLMVPCFLVNSVIFGCEFVFLGTLPLEFL